MQASVSDWYATDLAARLYAALATHADPAPLAALAEARREAEQDRRRLDPKNPEFKLAEWATPALYLRGTPQLLYDPTAPPEEIQEPPEARFAHGVVVRKVGEFVGRRREERLILKTLRGDHHAGALIHGIGGVGKSTLAAELLTRLMADHHLVVSTYGETAPETILEEIGKELARRQPRRGRPREPPPPPDRPRQSAAPTPSGRTAWTSSSAPSSPRSPSSSSWTTSRSNLADPKRARRRPHRQEPALADFLAAWLQTPGKSRLLVTSRHPFTPPGERPPPPGPPPPRPPLPRRDEKAPLAPPGPRSPQARRPPPRLRGRRRPPQSPRVPGRPPPRRRGPLQRRGAPPGEGPEEEGGVKNPGAWIRDEIGTDLDKALAETVTLAAADVLLEDLLRAPGPHPPRPPAPPRRLRLPSPRRPGRPRLAGRRGDRARAGPRGRGGTRASEEAHPRGQGAGRRANPQEPRPHGRRVARLRRGHRARPDAPHRDT